MQPFNTDPGIASFLSDYAELGWPLDLVPNYDLSRPIDSDEMECYNELSFFEEIATDPFKEEYLEYQAQYSHLFTCNELVAVGPDVKDILLVEMDRFKIVSSQEEKYLATSWLATCFAICVRGTTPAGECFLGMSHLSIQPVRLCLEILKNQLLMKGCLHSSIEFYAIGGMEKVEEDNDGGTFEAEIEIMRLSQEFNIKGVLFNIVEDEYDGVLSVIISEKNVFYTKDPEFLKKHHRISSENFICSEVLGRSQ